MFGHSKQFNFSAIKKRLEIIKEKLDKEKANESTDKNSNDSSESSLSDCSEEGSKSVVASASAVLSEANDILYSEEEIEIFENDFLLGDGDGDDDDEEEEEKDEDDDDDDNEEEKKKEEEEIITSEEGKDE